MLPPLYLHGLSSGDFVPALGQFLGSSVGLSAPVITKLTKTELGVLPVVLIIDNLIYVLIADVVDPELIQDTAHPEFVAHSGPTQRVKSLSVAALNVRESGFERRDPPLHCV